MIHQRVEITVNGECWGIEIFIPVTRCDVSKILFALVSIGCDGDFYLDAFENLTSGRINNGITYSNATARETVCVFARSESAASYFNLITHELHHLAVHIASMNGIDLKGEEVCYINGDVAEDIYPSVRGLLGVKV